MDKDEFVRHKGNGKDTDQSRYLTLFAQAEVGADLLTGDPAWDVFLSYLQAYRNECEASRDSIRETLEGAVTEESFRLAQLRLLEAKTRVSLIDAVMSIPKDIKEQGQKARALKDRLGGS